MSNELYLAIVAELSVAIENAMSLMTIDEFKQCSFFGSADVNQLANDKPLPLMKKKAA